MTRGAAVLAQTVPHLPPAVHVAVVDPGVGTHRRGDRDRHTRRRAGRARTTGCWSGPPTRSAASTAAVELTNTDWLLGDVSRTFHGRDVFAPAAARLAARRALRDAGPAVDPADLVRLPDPVVAVGDGWIEAEVLTVDRFGNVQLAAGRRAACRGSARAGGRSAAAGACAAQTFADAPRGELVVFADSAGRVAIAVNGGRAVVVLSVTPATSFAHGRSTSWRRVRR